MPRRYIYYYEEDKGEKKSFIKTLISKGIKYKYINTLLTFLLNKVFNTDMQCDNLRSCSIEKYRFLYNNEYLAALFSSLYSIQCTIIIIG